MKKKLSTCFYLTPMTSEFDNVFDHLKSKLCQKKKIEVVRLKETLFRSEVYWDAIKEEISCASCIIADLTNNNPNVLIEVGVALNACKFLTLITQEKNYKAPSNISQLHIETSEKVA